jgi:hypothetical protein
MMSNQIGVEIQFLEDVFEILIRHLRAIHGQSVELEDDEFWQVPLDRMYDLARLPEDLDVGRLADSLEWLTLVVAEPEKSLAFHLVYFADVLRAIGQSVVR